MSVIQVYLPTPGATEALGASLAGALAPGQCVYLRGELGAGKTTLVRGLLRALGYTGAVKSPTYTLIEPYELEGMSLYHCDLYRLADASELDYLGLRDLLHPASLVLIEWPERGLKALPPADWDISLHYAETQRRAELRCLAKTAWDLRSLSF